MPSLSPIILSIIAPFAVLFSRPVWNRALTLFIGTILCRGKRTVCAVLRVMGLSNETSFSSYHHVLNRVEWSLLFGAKILFYLIVCLICNRLAEEKPMEVAQTAWYEKKDATFSDLLKTVRKILWRDNLIFRKPIFESFPENSKGLDEAIESEERILWESWWIKVLIEHLAAA